MIVYSKIITQANTFTNVWYALALVSCMFSLLVCIGVDETLYELNSSDVLEIFVLLKHWVHVLTILLLI